MYVLEKQQQEQAFALRLIKALKSSIDELMRYKDTP
jgi:hypothetical protein